jgi:hypothetical protein
MEKHEENNARFAVRTIARFLKKSECLKKNTTNARHYQIS